MSLSSTDVTAMVRPLLNDSGNAIYTDAILAPFIAMAWDQLSDELAINGVDVAKNIAGSSGNTRSTAIPVALAASGTIKIDPYNDVTYSYLADMLYPTFIEEKASGADPAYYTPVMRKVWDDKDSNTTDIRYWTWKKGAIFLRAPLSNRDIRVSYISSLGDLALTAPVTIWYAPAKSFLVWKTAALAALFIGENQTRSQSLDSEAENNLEQTVRLAVKSGQNNPARHRPFRAFRSRRLI